MKKDRKKMKTAGRSSWKGHIQFSLINVPVRAYNATDKGNAVSFNQRHEGCGGRVKYDKRCETCEQTKLTTDEIVKGYDLGDGRYVTMSKEEIASVKIPSNKVIEITAFVDAKEISPSRFSGPSYMGPDGDVANTTFALLLEALKKTKKVGIGKVVLRDREIYVALMAEGNELVMHQLRRDEELKDLELAPDLKAGKDEVQLATDLIKSMTKSFDEIEIAPDQYTEKMREMIVAKSAGKTIEMEDIKVEAPVTNIMDVLKASIDKQKTA